MGQFPTNPSYITRAQTWAPTNNINPKSAWLFENQSGTLGTNLTGSSVYVGVTGTVRVIIAGTVGAQNTVTNLTLVSGGTGYTTANGVATTVTSIVPASNGAGLTVDITAAGGVITAAVINAAGTNYGLGDIITVTGGGANATFRVDGVRSLNPTAADAIEFVGAQAGSILPVVVDYVLIPAANAATDLIVGK
tara:strand:- start:825 stop:1403 length:579 start_codon:yes stop_codon:yes gene_type:complete